MEIVGHCRFSWLGISDTGRELITKEDAQSILWDPIRMAVRFYLFEHVMLPSVRSQTDQNFRFVVLVSDDMPAQYIDRLEQLTAPDRNIEILRSSSRDIGPALRPLMNSVIETNPKSVHFRLDDDDALCSTYVEELRSIMIKHDLPVGSAISFPRGANCFLHNGQAKHCELYKSFIAIGLAFVNGETYRRNPFLVQHRKVGHRMPHYVDPRFMAYQRTLHTVNNTSGYDTDLYDNALNSPGIARILRNHPEIATNCVTPEVEQAINSAFPNTDGQSLRQAVERSTNGRQLAETYGFL